MPQNSISVRELQQQLMAGTDVFILDLRPASQRMEWKIVGSNYLDAYDALNSGNLKVLDTLELPRNRQIVTVCAAGRTSQIAAAALQQKGFDAVSLEGGMKAWNYAWSTAVVGNEVVTIMQIRRVAKGCISYLMGSGQEAVVVDASLDPAVYVELANAYNWTIRHVMDTHIHADYVSRTLELAASTGAEHWFTRHAGVQYPFLPLENKDVLSFGNSSLKVMHTPGHTPESLCFLVNDAYLLTGDTLFVDGVGRPDLKADRPQAQQKAVQLFHSLKGIQALRHSDPVILPAHSRQPIGFDATAIAAKLSALQGTIELLKLEEDMFVEQILQRIPPTPPNYLQITEINKTGDRNGVQIEDLEAGANHCAIS